MRAAIATVEEFYAHALAIEHEAGERYAEFADHFGARGEEVLRGLCLQLAHAERTHFRELARDCEHLVLPAIDAGAYRWLDAAAPESAEREVLHRVAHARALLEVALAAEMRARDFFVWVARSAPSVDVRQVASIMAAEEMEHVQWVRQAIEYHDASDPDWERRLAESLAARSTQP